MTGPGGDRGGGAGGGKKYSFAVYRDVEIQFCSYQDGEIQCRNTIYYSLFSFQKTRKSIIANIKYNVKSLQNSLFIE